ncbi:MAG: hypothetical protein WA081_21960 [Desulfosalsimonadaceae bacterium]
MKEKIKNIYFNYLWWIWQTILVLVSIFFMVLGIEILIKSYKLDNPFYFMMIFFASNLIILISGVLMAGFIYRMVGVFKLVHPRKEDAEIHHEAIEEHEEKNESKD